MLKLTKKADYALMAMKHLAERSSERSLSAKDVADAYGIPPEALAKILQKLVKAGFCTRNTALMAVICWRAPHTRFRPLR